MIESKSNSKIKMLASLSTKKGRKENGMYLIEGLHMVTEAIKFGVRFLFRITLKPIFCQN